jgi:hypothetical protein
MRVKPERTAKAPAVTPHQFVKIWQEASSLGDVAAKIRRNKNACRVRAFRYRKEGVPLKEFPVEEIAVTDWDELARYAAEVLEGPGGAAAVGQREGSDAEARRV